MKLCAVRWLVLYWSVADVVGGSNDASVADLLDEDADLELIAYYRPPYYRHYRHSYYVPPPSPPSPPPYYGSPGWPSFQTLHDMNLDVWSTYYKLVYGQVPTDGFPRSPEGLWMFYSDVISQAGVREYPASEGNCPRDGRDTGVVYTTNNIYAPSGTFFCWHPYPYTAIGGNTWVEVMRKTDPFGDENVGAWFLYSPGSGIYFDTGSTTSFSEHSEAYAHFGVSGPDWNQDMCSKAAAAGYDSVQFTAHVDHVNYPCDTVNTGNPYLEYMGLEIVGVRLVGKYACGQSSGAPSSIRSGWQAVNQCTCDNSRPFLNCNEVPATAEMLASGNFSEILKEERARLSVQV